jgi:hypothetical protein
VGHHCQYRASPFLFGFFSPAITLVFAFAANGFAADPEMKIDDARFDNGAIVRFQEVGSDHVPMTDGIKKMAAGRTDKYTIFADLDSIIVNPSFENYDFYVRANSGAASNSLIRYTFQVTPYDTFPDQNKTIQIHLIEAGQDQTAQLSIPMHSLKAGVALSTTPSATVKIRLSGDTVSVDLQNKYLLPVTITAARVGEVTKAHWTAQPELETQLPITLGSDEGNNRTTLKWKVQPRAAGVLRDSIWPLASNAPPPRGSTQSSDAFETLDFSIDYVAVQGGFPHTLKAMRGLTFYPSLPVLLSLAVVGGILGGLIMFFGIRKDSGPMKFVKYLWPNLVLAIFIELLAILLFSFDNSKVQIGVVNLNPTLLIPAACLGAISVIYGFKLVEKWLGKAGPQSEPGS